MNFETSQQMMLFTDMVESTQCHMRQQSQQMMNSDHIEIPIDNDIDSATEQVVFNILSNQDSNNWSCNIQ